MVDSISVAMCTYNGALYVGQQLASIAAQTLKPAELIVCDDCSKDQTLGIVERFALDAPFPVRIHVNEHNVGSTRSFEKAIGLCREDLVALSDQDDVWRADKLALIREWFSENPEVGLVFSDAEIVDEQLRSCGRRLWSESGFDEKKRELIREGQAFDVLLPGYWVTGATMVFRSKFRDLVLPIPTDIPMIHDGWISLMIATVAEVAFIEQPLISYRQHPRQQLGAPITRSDNDKETLPKLESIIDRVRRTSSFLDVIKTLSAVHIRLSQKGIMKGYLASRIESQLRHLKTRANLPDQTLVRVAVVLSELIKMRYHKYSNGIYSAAKDLLRLNTVA